MGILYFIRLDSSSGGLIDLHLVPMQVRHFRLRRAAPADVQWVQRTLQREAQRFGTELSLNPANSLSIPPRSS